MIYQLIYPKVELDLLRLELTESEVDKLESMNLEEKTDFLIRNAGIDNPMSGYRELVIDLIEAGLDKCNIQKGICKKCGCTHFDPCHHPDYGNCWWEDENENLCSHCANPEIAEDPATEGPSEVIKPIF